MPASFADSSSASSCSESVADLADVEGGAGSARSGGAGKSASAASAAAKAAMQQEKALSLDELCRLTRFSRQEVRAFYRTLKQVCTFALISFLTRRRVEEATKRVALLWLQLPSNASACLLELVALLTRRVWRAHSLARYWAFQPDPDSFSVFFSLHLLVGFTWRSRRSSSAY